MGLGETDGNELENRKAEVETENSGRVAQGSETGEENRQPITPKVLDLLERISEYGYLTMHEVQFVFGNKTWAYKVVKGLRNQGLIADFDTLMYPRTGHHLTAKGYRILGQFDRLKVANRFQPERYSTFIFKHRMACAKVGLLLQRHPLVRKFLPESRLWNKRKRETDKVCDGEFLFQGPDYPKAERVGLEVELSLKNHDKLDESLRQLARREDLDQVWWICGDENIRRGLRRAQTRRNFGDQRHFFALLHEFLSVKGKAELMGSNGALRSIDPENPTLPSKPAALTPLSYPPVPWYEAEAMRPSDMGVAQSIPSPDTSVSSPQVRESMPTTEAPYPSFPQTARAEVHESPQPALRLEPSKTETPKQAASMPSQPAELEIDVLDTLKNVSDLVLEKFCELILGVLSLVCRERDYRGRPNYYWYADDSYNVLIIAVIFLAIFISLYQKLQRYERAHQHSVRTIHGRTRR